MPERRYKITVKRTVYQELVAEEVFAESAEQAAEYVKDDLHQYRNRLEKAFDLVEIDSDEAIDKVELLPDEAA